jgi:hypothetical protein
MDEILIAAIERYLHFVDRDSVSDERSEAHDTMMWTMRVCGVTFQDRDEARLLAQAMRESEYCIEWTIYFWHQGLRHEYEQVMLTQAARMNTLLV